ncbi:cuticle protein 16.8-like [Pectinophora gossypiella]|nr:cuticle protein 16.8-like [Pectinophora gossypiella]
MPSHVLLVSLTLALAAADVSHLTTSTAPPPPKPYAFSYTAGRYPGHADRQHTEVSDGSGVIRGQFSYVDPRQKIRTVQYVADKEGFHPLLSDPLPEHPVDSESVARAKDRHYQLYQKIAEEHANYPHPSPDASPRQSEAVVAATAKHAHLFQVIAEQHARIAAEREALQREEEERQHLQELQDIQH